MGEEQIDWKVVDRVWDMLMSRDSEMNELGLNLAKSALKLDSEVFRSRDWRSHGVNDVQRSEFVRYFYRLGFPSPEEQERIRKFAVEAKQKAEKLQLHDKASFWREVERTLFWIKQ